MGRRCGRRFEGYFRVIELESAEVLFCVGFLNILCGGLMSGILSAIFAIVYLSISCLCWLVSTTFMFP